MVSSLNLRGKVAVVGAFDTEVGKLPGVSPMELCVEAALGAIADAGISKDQVDGLVTCKSICKFSQDTVLLRVQGEAPRFQLSIMQLRP